MLIFLLLIFIVIIIVFIINDLFCKQSKFVIGGNSKIFEKRYFITGYDALKKQLIKYQFTNSRNYVLTTLSCDTETSDRKVTMLLEDDRIIVILTENCGKENELNYVVIMNILD